MVLNQRLFHHYTWLLNTLQAVTDRASLKNPRLTNSLLPQKALKIYLPPRQTNFWTEADSGFDFTFQELSSDATT